MEEYSCTKIVIYISQVPQYFMVTKLDLVVLSTHHLELNSHSVETHYSHTTKLTQLNGGAIYSENTNIAFDFNSATSFKYNTAENGGAIYLTSTSVLTFNGKVNTSMSYNHASKYGGGIYNKDIATAKQCNFINKSGRTKTTLPYCFIRFINNADGHYSTLTSQNNSADISGSFLQGGLLDRCQLKHI